MAGQRHCSSETRPGVSLEFAVDKWAPVQRRLGLSAAWHGHGTEGLMVKKIRAYRGVKNGCIAPSAGVVNSEPLNGSGNVSHLC